MRDFVGLTLSVGLPWLAGTLLVLLLWRRNDRSCWLLAAGYGYPLGAFAATLALRLLDAAGIRWTLAAVALPMLALILVLLGLTGSSRRLRMSETRMVPPAEALPVSLRGLFWVCLALIAIRLAGLGAEIAWRPLQPWDAWSQWATKTRVWFDYGRMAPFVSPQQWLMPGDAMRFVDMHSQYPATVPLLQVWTNLWLGHWDESLMNAPWLAIAVALGLAFYAQLRRAGALAPTAMLFTYLVLSLPFLDVHVALAGVADIMIATAYAMAAMALWLWTRTRERFDIVLAAAMVATLVTIKVEGTLWALTLVPTVLVALNRRVGLWVAFSLGAAALFYLAFGPAEVTMFGYVLRTQFENVSLPLMQHLFIMDNWHLLWYAAAAVVVGRHRRLWAPDLIAMTATMLGALGFVFIVYFFSSAGGGVDDESLVNRLLLHMVPVMVFYLALLLHDPPRLSGQHEGAHALPPRKTNV